MSERLQQIRSAGSAPAIDPHDVTAETQITFTLENQPTDRKHLIETTLGGLAAFDYNNDGLVDLYFFPDLTKQTPSHWNRLYRNDGNFRFTDVTAEAGVRGDGYAMGAAASDYDNDGHVGLFVVGVDRNILYRFLALATGTNGSPQPHT
jgi:enediyne biosynthesis protein E4